MNRVVAVCMSAALLTLVLSGCRQENEPQLRVGTHLWPGYESLFLAQARGYFAAADIKLIELPGSTESIRAFENRSIDAGTFTLDEVLRIVDHGHELRIVLVFDASSGADALVARDSIRELAQLKGRSIGVETGGLGAYVLARVLEAAQLKLADVNVVAMSAAETEAAYRAGRVDAVVTYEPHVGQLRALGARVLFDSTKLPGEIADVMVVHKRVLEQPHRNLRALINGHFRALEALERDPAEAIRTMARRQQITPEAFAASLKLLTLPDRAANARMLESADGAIAGSLRRVAAVLAQHGIVRDPRVPAELIDPRFVREDR